MKFSPLLLIAFVFANPANAQWKSTAIAPIPTLPAIAIYPEDSGKKNSEQWSVMSAQFGETKISFTSVRNVNVPSVTPFLPDPKRNTGAAVVIAPGGAFLQLLIDDEGFKIGRWLADHGVAAFVLKYRVEPTATEPAVFAEELGKRLTAAADPGAKVQYSDSTAVADAQQALAIVRDQAKHFAIDPKRIGVMGFSAGAMTELRTIRESAASAEPAFFGYIYGPMAPIDVPSNAPPMFAAIAMDDGLFGGKGFGVVDSWKKAGRPVELHAYEHGGHGFGAGVPGTTSTGVLPQLLAWLKSKGLLDQAR